VTSKGSHLIIAVEGLDSRTDVDHRAGFFLFVDRKDRIKLPPRTWFITDIIGMTVIDEQGVSIGIISDVLALPANHVYVVHRDQREVLIPAIPNVVRDVDVGRRTMVVRLPEGLLEL
jgi:16S rRNA processing protein RimM